VDIDAQAVEVTKLSLLLKVLEEESGQLSLGLERVLPDLGDNIKCGNSLIGWDYFEGQLIPDEKELERVNPFDWQRNFPLVFARGGFDAVIGNPPYVRQETLGDDKKYFQTQYQVYAGTADLYSYFIERGVNLLNRGGMFSYIVANKWMRANYGRALRTWLKTKCIEEITDFGDLPVFKNATTYPCILRVSNNPLHNQPWVTSVKTLDFTSLSKYVKNNGDQIDQTKFDDDGWALVNSNVQKILEKINVSSNQLIEYVNGKIYYGIKTGLNEAFVIDLETKNKLISEDKKSQELIKPFVIGRDIKRYQALKNNLFLIFLPKGWTKLNKNGHASKWFSQSFPAIYNYLVFFEQKASKRFDQGEYWWELRACNYYEEFNKPKIMIPDISLRGNCAFDENGEFYSVNTSYIIPVNDKYLLGLLNSKLIDFVYRQISSSYRGGYLRYIYQYMAKLPIHKIDFTNPTEVEQHNRMVSLVERMLELHKRDPQTPQEADRIQREIAATDGAIDKLVNELYGLTEEEVRIVEGGS
jgi:hypothetical protein